MKEDTPHKKDLDRLMRIFQAEPKSDPAAVKLIQEIWGNNDDEEEVYCHVCLERVKNTIHAQALFPVSEVEYCDHCGLGYCKEEHWKAEEHRHG